MIRESLKKHQINSTPEFRFRGVEPGRLENFSDAVFALAMTLVLISTSAPTNFEQIKRFAWDIIPFCACIVLILLIWYQHFIFFYRYGLRNASVLVLNTLFLSIVLFYVYPLKFLTKMILIPVGLLFRQDQLISEMMTIYQGTDMSFLMVIYGVGATCVFFVLMLMYRYAMRHSDLLELNTIEQFDTRASMRMNLFMGLIPFLSVLVALLFRRDMLVGMYAGFAYCLYFPVMFVFGSRVSRQRKKLLETLDKPDAS
jgi:uncharacterized membrane protein